MAQPSSRARLAGGFPIVAGILIGCVAGFLLGQPTIGFLVGGGVGIVLATAIWLVDRR